MSKISFLPKNHWSNNLITCIDHFLLNAVRNYCPRVGLSLCRSAFCCPTFAFPAPILHARFAPCQWDGKFIILYSTRTMCSFLYDCIFFCKSLVLEKQMKWDINRFSETEMAFLFGDLIEDDISVLPQSIKEVVSC